jgi:hypothetical protein
LEALTITSADAMNLFFFFALHQAIFNLVNNVYAAPNQIPSIYDMQEVCHLFIALCMQCNQHLFGVAKSSWITLSKKIKKMVLVK